MEELHEAGKFEPNRLATRALFSRRGPWGGWALGTAGVLAGLGVLGQTSGSLAFLSFLVFAAAWVPLTMGTALDQFLEEDRTLPARVARWSPAIGKALLQGLAIGVVHCAVLSLQGPGELVLFSWFFLTWWWLLAVREVVLHERPAAAGVVEGFIAAWILPLVTMGRVVRWMTTLDRNRVLSRARPGRARLLSSALQLMTSPLVACFLTALLAVPVLVLTVGVAGLPFPGETVAAAAMLVVTVLGIQHATVSWTYECMAASVEDRRRLGVEGVGALPPGEG